MTHKSLAVLVVLLALGCSDKETKDGAGTVKGDFIRTGGVAPGAPVPLMGTLSFVSAQNAINVPVERDGKFEVRLPPGHYTVQGTSPQIGSGGRPCSAPMEVDVTAGEVQRQQVVCQIR